jgi:transposase
MLRLPLLFIKDAAKTVKRICLEEFTKTTDSVLTELLGISSLIVTMFSLRKEGDQTVLHLMCAHRNEIALCPKCGAMTTDVHEEKKRCVRHLDIWGKKTFLHFNSRRFKCGDCGKIFTERLPFVDRSRRQSLDYELHIYRACRSGNRKDIALREGLSQSTVKEIFFRLAKNQVGKHAARCPRILGIDEISLKKRHKQFAMVLSDIESKCILEVFPERSKEVLENWIEGFDDNQKKKIRYVSIDMWGPYYYAVRDKLPKARIVVDRFHVVKHLNERLTAIRKKYQKESSAEIKEILKGSRWVLARNRENLTAKDEKILEKVLENCEELRTLYLLKEEFRLIFEKAKNRENAEKYLKVWKWKAEHAGNPFLLKFVKTLRNWWGEILNYFYERVTNGFVEGLNGALRNIIRRAFGYRNFSNFRLQALVEQGLPTNPR